MGETTIFFLRHGQPDNPKKLIKGLGPFPLTDIGREQIETQAKRLVKEKISFVFTSPVKRCLDSAEIVVQILKVSLLVEGDLTEWTSTIDGQPVNLIKSFSLKDYNYCFEPQSDVLERMMNFVRMILEKYRGKKVIAVSHQGPIDLLISALLGKDISQMPGQGLVTKMGEAVKVVFDSGDSPVRFERHPFD